MVTQLSIQEQRKLFRLKLLFLGVLVIFTIQFILPGSKTKEAWPIIRWDMFSDATSPPATSGALWSLEVIAYDSDEQAMVFSLEDIYGSAHITSPAAVTESVITFAVQKVDLEVQMQTRKAFLERLSYLSNREIVRAEVWSREHDYDMTQQVYPDMANPSRATLIIALTYDETIIPAEVE